MSTPLWTKMVKTRKSHRCWGCGKEFPPGTQLECATEVEGGHIMSIYWCDTCLKFADAFDFWDGISDGIDIGEMAQDPDYTGFALSMTLDSLSKSL